MHGVTELTEQVMVRLTPDLRAALEADAKANERNLSQTIRLAIRQHFGAGEMGRKSQEEPVAPATSAPVLPSPPPESANCTHPKVALVQLAGGLPRCGACGTYRKADGTWPT